MTADGAQASCLLLTEEVWGSALRAARGLHARGIPVRIATLGRGAAIFGRSTACTAALDVPLERADDFVDEVLGWAHRSAPGDAPIVVIPLSDRLLELLHQARGDVTDSFRLALPRRDVIDDLLDKGRSLRVAERAGLSVPPWIVVRSLDDLPAIGSLPLPVGARPTASARADGVPKVTVRADAPALAMAVREHVTSGHELLVQHHLTVPDDAVEFAIVWRSPDGTTTVVCTGRKRRQSAPGGGVMVWGQTAPLPDVEAATVRYLDESGFTGLGGIEVIRHEGRLHFIEFNPRLEAIHFIAQRAGVDTVQLEFDALAYGRLPEQRARPQPATAWVGSAWLQRLVSDPTSRGDVLVDRWRFARSPGRVRAVWDRRDPLPSVALVARLLRRLPHRVRSRSRMASV